MEKKFFIACQLADSDQVKKIVNEKQKIVERNGFVGSLRGIFGVSGNALFHLFADISAKKEQYFHPDKLIVFELTKFLTEHRCDINSRGHFQRPVINQLLRNNSINACEKLLIALYLVEKGVNCEVMDEEGLLPIDELPYNILATRKFGIWEKDLWYQRVKHKRIFSSLEEITQLVDYTDRDKFKYAIKEWKLKTEDKILTSVEKELEEYQKYSLFSEGVLICFNELRDTYLKLRDLHNDINYKKYIDFNYMMDTCIDAGLAKEELMGFENEFEEHKNSIFENVKLQVRLYNLRYRFVYLVIDIAFDKSNPGYKERIISKQEQIRIEKEYAKEQWIM